MPPSATSSCLYARFNPLRSFSFLPASTRAVIWQVPSRLAYSTATLSDSEGTDPTESQYHQHTSPNHVRRVNLVRRRATEKRSTSRFSHQHTTVGYWHRVSDALKSEITIKHDPLRLAFARGDKEEILRTCLELDLLKAPGGQGAQQGLLRLQARRAISSPTDQSLADGFVDLIKGEKLLPNLALNNAILKYYHTNGEFEKVISFTSWLIDHDKACCDEETYARSIVACAIQQRPRANVEDLYTSSLSWTNDQFREYHFSPEATLEDPIPLDRLASWKAGLPLLNAIAIARMIRGDAKDAYKAVDTRVRLRPTLAPTQITSECIRLHPPTEAFILHQALCSDYDPAVVNARSKTDMVILLRLLRTAAESSDNDRTSGFHGNLLRSMFVVVYSRGGLLPFAHSSITELLIGLACSADLLHGCLPAATEPRLTRWYALAKRILVPYCSGARGETLAPAFSKLISQASKYHAPPQLVATMLHDMSALNVPLTQVTMRVLLEHAWMSRDTARVHSAWTHLVEHAEQAGNMPALADWRCLAKACADLGDVAYVHSEMTNRAHAVTPEISTEIDMVLKRNKERKLNVAVSGKWTRDAESVKERLGGFDDLITRLEADVAVLEIQTKQQMSARTHTPLVQLGIGAHPSWQGWYDRTEQRVRKLFHQLTFGRPDTPATTVPGPPADTERRRVDMTEVRFQKWNAMNHVFAITEAYEEALARRHKHVPFEQTWSRLVWREPSAGLSDFIDEQGNRRPPPDTTGEDVQIPAWVKNARDPKEILRLRERTVSAV